MPREDRRILFSQDEVYKAIFALCTQKQMPKPPPGIIEKVYQDEADDSKIYMEIKNPQDSERDRTLEFSRDFVAAALMLFCRGCGIPLPKSAKKSVLVQDNNIILRVQVG